MMAIPVRSKKTRPRRKAYVIFCEGLKTEPAYFKALKEKLELETITIELVKEEKDVDGIIKKLNMPNSNYYKYRKHEIKACLIDMDSDDQESINKQTRKAEKNGLRIFWSNPCFEFWLCLHFKRDCLQPDVEACSSFWEKHLLPDLPNFSKDPDESCLTTLMYNLSDALDRAKKLKPPCDKRSGVANTQVHELIEMIYQDELTN